MPARPDASTTQRASISSGRPSRSQRTRCAAVASARSASHRDAVDELDARLPRALAEEVLEDAAVDLVARRREVACSRRAPAPRRCRGGLRRRRSGSRTSSAAGRPGAPSARARCRSNGRRSRPWTRRPCASLRARDAGAARARRLPRSGKRCRNCSDSVRPASPPPRMATSVRIGPPSGRIRPATAGRSRSGRRPLPCSSTAGTCS